MRYLGVTRSAHRSLLGLCMLSLSACQSLTGVGHSSLSDTTPPVTPSSTVVSPDLPPDSAVTPSDNASASTPVSLRQSLNINRLHHCQAQLAVLRTLKSPQYLRFKQGFDGLMQGASLYAGLRGNVNDDTQNTIDALYLYKVNYLCARITQSVMNGLVVQGDAAK